MSSVDVLVEAGKQCENTAGRTDKPKYALKVKLSTTFSDIVSGNEISHHSTINPAAAEVPICGLYYSNGHGF